MFQSRGPWLARRFCCPPGSSLTMASSAPLDPSRRFMYYAAGLRPEVCSGLGSRGSPIYSADLFPSCRLPYPDRLNGCTWLFLYRPHCPSPSLHRLGICSATIVGSQVISVTRLQSSLYGTARRVAGPSPTRTFTFELSPPKSPPRDVEYHYAGKSANSRDRTFTGKTSSIMGCEQRPQRDRKETRKEKVSLSPF